MTRFPLPPGSLVGSLRIAIVVATTIGIALTQQESLSNPFILALLAGALIYAVLTAAQQWRPTYATAFVDLAFLALLTYATGGADSDVGLAFTLLPLLVALNGSHHRLTLIAVVVSVGVFALTVYLHAELTPDGNRGYALIQTLNAAGRGCLVIALAGLLAHRARAYRDLSLASRRIVSDVLHSDDRTRREQARLLHDMPLQNLHVALHSLRDEERDNHLLAESLLEGAIDQLRGQIVELYPPSLQHLGLGPALEQLVERTRQPDGIAIDTDVQTLPSNEWDQLLYTTARELLTNVAKHSCATSASLSLRVANSQAILEVRDNGVGFIGPPAPDSHLGVRDIRDRVQAIGGAFNITTRPTIDGSAVTVHIPLDGLESPDLPGQLQSNQAL